MEKDKALVWQAKMAEQAERYDDMVKFMKELVEMDGSVLETEERNLLSVAYKNIVGARRSAWRIISSEVNNPSGKDEQEKEARKKIAPQFLEQVTTELKGLCGDVLSLLDNFLIPKADTAETKVFYQKMKGDYFRYLAEITTDDERKDMVEKAREAYKAAHDKAADMPTTHPVRLGLALNFSVFHYEIVDNREEACRLAKQAFDDACNDLDELQEESYKDCTLIMQLLRDNMTLWASDIEDNQGED